MFTVKAANNNYYYAWGGGGGGGRMQNKLLKVAGNSYWGREDAVHIKSVFPYCWEVYEVHNSKSWWGFAAKRGWYL